MPKYRQLFPGIGEAVARRTVLRKMKNGHDETWGNVAQRVAKGNALLTNNTRIKNKEEHIESEASELESYIAKGALLMSGRHLQHGDEDQINKNQELLTNCSTASSSFVLFYLLMNGSGVGRSYDDDLMIVDWSKNMPFVKVVLDESHADFNYQEMESVREAKRKYSNAIWFEIEDSREGWGHAVEKLEIMTFQKKYSEITLVIDFSKVRPSGSPIVGMQGRPASGPKPLMDSFEKIASLKGSSMEKWEQTMWVDHYLSECVLVGGSRRSARIATKSWDDKTVLDYIKVKKGGFLWSANNSVMTDDDFWKQDTDYKKQVLQEILKASYYDGTGEPGMINRDKLVQKDDGIEIFKDGKFAESEKYKPSVDAQEYMAVVANKVLSKKYTQITNPCFAPGTIIQTRDGYFPIEDLVGKEVEIWDGNQWVMIDNFRVTGENQETLKITLHDGSEIIVTPYHTFYLEDGTKLEARELVVGDRLEVSNAPGFNVLEKQKDFNQIEKIEKNVIEEKVYCCTVPTTHKITLGCGISSGQCGEISLNMMSGYCVHGDTRIAHKDGYSKIKNVIGKEIEVYNGEKWSKVKPFKTGENQELLRVHFSDGSYLDCTDYHEFSIKNHRQSNKYSKVEAKNLRAGDILPTFRILDREDDIVGNKLNDAYTYGAFLGDGTYYLKNGKYERFVLALYPGKYDLPISGNKNVSTNRKNGVRKTTVSHLDKQKLKELKLSDNLPEWLFSLDRESIEQFILGWLDTDGLHHVGTGGISISTSKEGVARDLQLLLRRIGISYASVSKKYSKGEINNFGVRNSDLWNVYIPSSEAGLLQGYRVQSDYEIDLNRTVKHQRVVEVEKIDGLHDTYCFTEPERHMGVFNNVLTYQCVIADTVPYFTKNDDEAEAVMRATTRALIRVNTMDSLYKKEVIRTNRIGVGMTGLHEYAWDRFGYGFRDLIDEDKSKDFWMTLSRFKRAIDDEAEKYSNQLGVNVPHTNSTIKPSGSVSKIFGLTEGCHLPSMREYLRWVQFSSTDPLVEDYKKKDYPTKELKSYKGTTIIGFPTQPEICRLGMGSKLVTAAEATPEEQYKWLMLLEKYWINGVDEDGNPLTSNTGNQISYTLKYKPDETDFDLYSKTVKEYQSKVRCCSVMPQVDGTAYEYQPEQPITRDYYNKLVAKISGEDVKEDVDFEHVDCGTGGCPIDFYK